MHTTANHPSSARAAFSLQLTRQPVTTQSPWPLELMVTSGCAWLTHDQPGQADDVLSLGDTRHIAAGARVFASGLPLATVALRPLPGSTP